MLDLNKPLQTRSGCPARLLCRDFKGYPGKQSKLLFAILDPKGFEISNATYADGRCCETHEADYDIINVTTKREGWIAINTTIKPIEIPAIRFCNGCIYRTEKEALDAACCSGNKHVAVRVEWTD